MKPDPPKPGDSVLVRLHDGRIIEAQVCVGGIMETVRGTKVRVRCGEMTYTVDSTQIVQLD